MKNTIDIIKNYRSLSNLQKVKLFIKEAYLSATDYHDGNHYAALTDITSIPALTIVHKKMINNQTGRLILKQKPRVRNDVVQKIAQLPQNTFGKAYYNFLANNNFDPEGRPLVNHIPDLELAYVCQRYKEIHDFNHVLLEDFVTVKNQLLIKWFEMIQLGLPSAAMASLITPILERDINVGELASFCRKAEKCKFVMNVYFEKHFEQDLVQFEQFRMTSERSQIQFDSLQKSECLQYERICKTNFIIVIDKQKKCLFSSQFYTLEMHQYEKQDFVNEY